VARKIDDLEKWGRKTARERYTQSNGSLAGDDGQQAPQAPEDKHDSKYDNDVSLSGWLRGPDATKKPGFCKPWDKR
jgi:hypothetical protein